MQSDRVTHRCPGREAWWPYVQGELSDDERAHMAGYLRTCDRCMLDLAATKNALQDQQQSGIQLAPPAELLAHARGEIAPPPQLGVSRAAPAAAAPTAKRPRLRLFSYAVAASLVAAIGVQVIDWSGGPYGSGDVASQLVALDSSLRQSGQSWQALSDNQAKAFGPPQRSIGTASSTATAYAAGQALVTLRIAVDQARDGQMAAAALQDFIPHLDDARAGRARDLVRQLRQNPQQLSSLSSLIQDLAAEAEERMAELPTSTYFQLGQWTQVLQTGAQLALTTRQPLANLLDIAGQSAVAGKFIETLQDEGSTALHAALEQLRAVFAGGAAQAGDERRVLLAVGAVGRAIPQ